MRVVARLLLPRERGYKIIADDACAYGSVVLNGVVGHVQFPRGEDHHTGTRRNGGYHISIDCLVSGRILKK